MMLEVRKTISASRRSLSVVFASKILPLLLPRQGFIASYASCKDELETDAINHYLAMEGRLLLPKIEQQELQFYHVKDLSNQLQEGPFGIFEPDPMKCQMIPHSSIKAVIVPGLGFDKAHHRLGYGRGFYDRFLKLLRPEALTFGLGFKEQWLADFLPTFKTDVPLKHLLLI